MREWVRLDERLSREMDGDDGGAESCEANANFANLGL